jgi:hypothetical protein
MHSGNYHKVQPTINSPRDYVATKGNLYTHDKRDALNWVVLPLSSLAAGSIFQIISRAAETAAGSSRRLRLTSAEQNATAHRHPRGLDSEVGRLRFEGRKTSYLIVHSLYKSAFIHS